MRTISICASRESRCVRSCMAFLLLAVATVSCLSPATIWSEDFKSPNGYWVGTAVTKQWGGPGTAAIITSVLLKRAGSSDSPQLVFQLDNETVWPKGITSLQMTWLTPTHLQIAYKGHATVIFEAIRVADLDISVRNLAVEPVQD